MKSKTRIAVIVAVCAMYATPALAISFGDMLKGAGEGINDFSSGKGLDALKAKTVAEVNIPADVVRLKSKGYYAIVGLVSDVAFKHKYNVIIQAPSAKAGNEIKQFITLGEKRNAELKSKGNKFNLKQQMKKVSRFKLVKASKYKILLRSRATSFTGEGEI